MAACRRTWVGVALFSACVNLLILTIIPMYMMQVYDRVLITSSIDALLTLSAMVAVGLATFGLLDAVRNRILARVGAWFERELGSPILGGAIAEARRAGAASRRSGCTHPPRCRAGSAWWAPSRCSAAPRSTTWPPASGSPRPAARRCVRALNDADAAIRNADAITATSCSAAPCACQRARRTDQFLVRALARPTARSTPAQFRQHRAHLLQPQQRRRGRSRQRPWQQHLLGPGGERVRQLLVVLRPQQLDQRVQKRRQPCPVAVRLQRDQRRHQVAEWPRWSPLGRLLGRRSSRDDGAFQRSEALVYLGEGDFDGAQPRVEPVASGPAVVAADLDERAVALAPEDALV